MSGSAARLARLGVTVFLAACSSERSVERPAQPSEPENALLDWPGPQRLRQHSLGAGCGAELWDVKTAAEPLARYIDPTPRPTTIAELASLLRPQRQGGARIKGVETTIWILKNVTLVEVRPEQDQDYHLVVGDGQFTMIVEIPNPTCIGDGPLAEEIASARHAFEAHGAGSSARRSGGGEIISVAGVGFFDRPHNQTGAAVNQLELHPVTAICFGKDCRLEIPTGAALEARREAQGRERARRAALEADVNALCRSTRVARETVGQYRQFLAACRGQAESRPAECTLQTAKAADAEVRSVLTKANDDENAFLRKWGSEAFLGIDCE